MADGVNKYTIAWPFDAELTFTRRNSQTYDQWLGSTAATLNDYNLEQQYRDWCTEAGLDFGVDVEPTFAGESLTTGGAFYSLIGGSTGAQVGFGNFYRYNPAGGGAFMPIFDPATVINTSETDGGGRVIGRPDPYAPFIIYNSYFNHPTQAADIKMQRSADGQILIIFMRSSDFSFTRYDTAIRITPNQMLFYWAWSSGNLIDPGFEVRIIGETGNVVDSFSDDDPRFSFHASEWVFDYKQYGVSGKVLEDLDVTKWRVNTYDAQSNIVRDTQVVDTSVSQDFTLQVSNPRPVFLAAWPEAELWMAQTDYSLGDIVYPTSPIDTPYYYRCDAAGQSSSSEPVWPTTVGGTITDNTVTWTRVDRIVQPQMQGPIIPLESF